jgi:DNA-binding NarL/FixJ family response regulator
MASEGVANGVLIPKLIHSWNVRKEDEMTDLNDIKITNRDQQVLSLLVQGCSNKEIAHTLQISPRTVKQHLRTLFLRAGIRHGRKRVKLATAMFEWQRGQHATL